MHASSDAHPAILQTFKNMSASAGDIGAGAGLERYRIFEMSALANQPFEIRDLDIQQNSTMHLTAIFRRAIVVPLDDEAAKAMEKDNVDEFTDVAQIDIGDDPEFYDLLGTNVFAQINEATGALIDDFETETIGPEKLHEALRIIAKSINRLPRKSNQRRFFEDLHELMQIAAKERRPVYFIF